MSDDKTLDALGKILAQEGDDVPADDLEAWSLGLLDDEEAQRLEAAARSPEEKRRLEAHRPLGPELRARLADEAAARLGAARDEAPPGDPSPASGPRRLDHRAPPPSRRRWWIPLAAAVAATLVLWVGVLPSDPEPLPAYQVEVQGGQQDLRGPVPSVGEVLSPVLAPGGRLSVVLRPDTVVDGRLAAQVYAGSADRLVPVDAEAEIAETGAVRLRIDHARLAVLGSGPTELWVSLGRRSDLPSQEDVAAAAGGAVVPDEWRLFRIPVEVAAEIGGETEALEDP